MHRHPIDVLTKQFALEAIAFKAPIEIMTQNVNSETPAKNFTENQ